jgi:hypothetical protein
MIWEVDENMDEVISWDELQLTFCRNVSDITTPSSVISQIGCEPSAFFRITEVTIICNNLVSLDLKLSGFFFFVTIHILCFNREHCNRIDNMHLI